MHLVSSSLPEQLLPQIQHNILEPLSQSLWESQASHCLLSRCAGIVPLCDEPTWVSGYFCMSWALYFSGANTHFSNKRLLHVSYA